MSETNTDSATCSAAIAKARREKLWECLGTIQAWVSKRALWEHNTETTLTMLARKVQETIDSVDKAGWRAAKEFEQNPTEPPTDKFLKVFPK